MKKILTSLAIAISAFAVANAYAEEMFSTELFSVVIPTDMVSSINKNNGLSLVFPGDNDLIRGSIILAAEQGRPERTDVKWRQVKAHVLGKDIKILFEKEVNTPALTWRAIGTEGAMLEGNKVKQFQYYGETNNAMYFLSYFCFVGACSDIEAAISKILTTFQPVENTKQPS